MKIAWCPRHRGVMRIAFLDTTNHPQFNKPCPRCGESLVQQTRNKYPNEQSRERIKPGNLDERVNINMEDWRAGHHSLCDTHRCLALQRPNLKKQIEKEQGSVSPESKDSIPTGELCSCCRFFVVRPEAILCGWCVDCPTGYCDVPNKYTKKRAKK